ncbi:uncharacterized protein BX663DRAFT_564745 [Cokeromyces recurvatus]|uniref:uncharacterized protein n=1 Tax=Cokeromyces recurvatus TaxID=90255 RepID=UPI00221F270B|nr:uncharacterized protein BX663DRAFT_564745 [Cokeromyces recurvatus]KAI7898355.1 hypothetical protein BX663DRAFT_564745 [Cokeromyces recurvatus]
MTGLSLAEYLWENMNSVQFNVRLLETYTLQTRNENRNKFICAFKNLKRRKRYNKRTMNPKICKLKKDLDEFLKTTECKDYFMNCALISSINNEEIAREIFKSSIRSATYTKKTRGVKRQRSNNDNEEEEEEKNEDDPSSLHNHLPQQLQPQAEQQQQENDAVDSKKNILWSFLILWVRMSHSTLLKNKKLTVVSWIILTVMAN